MKTYKYNLSHYHLLTGDMGFLLPAACMEVLPGDRIRHAMSILMRVTPLATPVMHPVSVRAHCFFVPNRIVWPEWEDFITGRDTEAVIPPFTINTGNDNSLLDHLGVPLVNGIEVSELPIRAYNMIWNEYFRDQDLHTARAEDDVTLARISWEKDYFTKCRANAQQGTEFVIPFSAGRAVVASDADFAANDAISVYSSQEQEHRRLQTSGGAGDNVVGAEAGGDANNELYADLSQATGGFAISDLRLTLAQQRIAEAREFYGDRYEDLLAWYGVRARDSRLQKPEYLGGGKQTVAFSEVLATAEGTTTEVGDMRGHGIAALRTRPYRRFFEEHGYVLCLISVRPKTVYSEAIHRHWLRSTKDDFWQREFEVLGPQPVTHRELYAPAASATTVFGYTDRFEELRNLPSYVTGDFRASGQSDDWHYARQFGSQPTLNGSFITCDPTDRVYMATSVPELYITCNHHISARRLVRPAGIPRTL